MNYFSTSSSTPPENAISSEFQLSLKQRIVGFVTFLGLGALFLFLATWSLISPRRFAKFYSLGTLFIIGSVFFLVPPRRILSSMFDPSRVWSAVAYFGSMIAVICLAAYNKGAGLILIMMIVQVLSGLYFGASYIPFAQSCIRSTVGNIVTAV